VFVGADTQINTSCLVSAIDETGFRGLLNGKKAMVI
jgi:hypothetical protein